MEPEEKGTDETSVWTVENAPPAPVRTDAAGLSEATTTLPDCVELSAMPLNWKSPFASAYVMPTGEVPARSSTRMPRSGRLPSTAFPTPFSSATRRS